MLAEYYTSRSNYYRRPTGDPDYGIASDEELIVTQGIFFQLFQSLQKHFLDPVMTKEMLWGSLRSSSVECLVCLANVIPPSAMLPFEDEIKWLLEGEGGTYVPKPVDTKEQVLTAEMEKVVDCLAQRSHEEWAHGKIKGGWKYGPKRDDANKIHPLLIPYSELSEADKENNRVGCREQVKVIKALGWNFSLDANKSISQSQQTKPTYDENGQWRPQPVDLSSSVRLNPDVLAISERLAENSHDVWAVGKLKQLKPGETHPDLIPYDQLTDEQKQYDRNASISTLRFLIFQGYALNKQAKKRTLMGQRFTIYLLKMLLHYLRTEGDCLIV